MKGSKIITSLMALVLALGVGGCNSKEDDQTVTGDESTPVVIPDANGPSELLDIISETGNYSVWFEYNQYYGETVIPDAEYESTWNEDMSDAEKFETFEKNYSDSIELTDSICYNIVVTFDYIIMTNYVLDEKGNYNLYEELIVLNDPEADKGYIYMHTTDGYSWLAERNRFSSSNAQGYVDDGYWTIWDSLDFYFSADDFVATGETITGEDGLDYDVYEMNTAGWFTTLGGSFVYGAVAYSRDLHDIQKEGTYFSSDNQTLTSLFSYKQIYEGIHALVEPDDPDNYEEDWDIESWEVRYYSDKFTATVYNAGYEDEDATQEVYGTYNLLNDAGLILGL